MNTLQVAEANNSGASWNSQSCVDSSLPQIANQEPSPAPADSTASAHEHQNIANHLIADSTLTADHPDLPTSSHGTPAILQNADALVIEHDLEEHKSRSSGQTRSLPTSRLSIFEDKIEDFDIEAPPPGTYRFPIIAQPKPGQRLTYAEPFSRPDLMPPADAPLRVQLEAFASRWVLWTAPIENSDRRQEVLNCIANKMEKVWAMAVQQEVGLMSSQDEEHPRKRQKGPAEVTRALYPDYEKDLKKKNPPNPPDIIVFRSNAYKGSQNVIKAGEMEEAGVSVASVRERVEKRDLEDGKHLLRSVCDHLGHSKIEISDWLGKGTKTKQSPWARDLLIYCLFEVQASKVAINQFEGLMANFKTTGQKKNTVARIDHEQERADYYLALALELDLIRGHKFETEDNAYESSESDEEMEEQAATGEDAISISDDEEHQSEDDTVCQENDQDHEMVVDNVQVGSSIEENTIKAEENAEMSVDTDLAGPQSSDSVDDQGILPPTEVAVPKQEAKEDHDSSETEVVAIKDSVPQVDSRASEPESQAIKTAYLEQVIGPKVNILLTNANHPPINVSTTGWREMRDALTTAGVAKDVRNFLTRELNEHVQKQKETLETASRQSLKIVLRTEQGFNVEDFSSKRISTYKDFQYRYTTQSTLAQRRNMDEIITDYVKQHRKRQSDTEGGSNKASRHGRYETLTHPDDPRRTTIVHGYWKNKNGRQVEGSDWFFAGFEGPADQHDALLRSHQEELMESLLPSRPETPYYAHHSNKHSHVTSETEDELQLSGSQKPTPVRSLVGREPSATGRGLSAKQKGKRKAASRLSLSNLGSQPKRLKLLTGAASSRSNKKRRVVDSDENEFGDDAESDDEWVPGY